MKTSTIVWIIIILIIIIGLGWYFVSMNGTLGAYQAPTGQTQTNQNPNGPDYNSSGTPGSSTQSQTTTSATPVITLAASASLGSHLAAANGMTLYTYSPDKPGVSNCTGQCAANWPPYTMPAGTTLVGATGINGQLATITRADGSTQLTYNGAPVYFYIKDAKPGDTVGQGVGGVWYVVKP
jgi:predicted lipoprotein with Yx(FWY)xxD motif